VQERGQQPQVPASEQAQAHEASSASVQQQALRSQQREQEQASEQAQAQAQQRREQGLAQEQA
jgi:hypothetical protein